MIRRIVLVLVGVVLCCRGAWAEAGDPAVTHVCAVAPNVMAIEIDAKEVVLGKLQPYEKRRGDECEEDLAQGQAWLKRNGVIVGGMAGRERRMWREFDRMVGSDIDTTAAGKAGSYRVSSTADGEYLSPVAPVAVYRKSKPTNLAQVGPCKWDYAVRHVIYLKLPKPMKDGKQYDVDLSALKLTNVKYMHDPMRVRSEAVHANHLGFRPDDPVKRAYLSCWMGDGGGLSYAEGLRFRVYDLDGSKVMFEGKTRLGVAATAGEDAYEANHNGTNVYWMDFGELRIPGRYVVMVEGIGTSYPFEIGGDVYAKAFAVSAKGFYYQRSGIELKPPYAIFTRPRNFSPQDGELVYASTCTLTDSGKGLVAKGTDKDNFGLLTQGATDAVVANAWGGYADAADWGRRIGHLDGSRYLLELVELYPAYFEKVTLNIPESGNGLPDAVNEALWGLDVFRRMQTQEGGIRGGIEQAGHPWWAEPSWMNSRKSLAYAPDAWCSYVYAGDAARAAVVVAEYRPELAREYARSAVRAFEFAEKVTGSGQNYEHTAVRDGRNRAALELWRLSGEGKYHEIFLATTVFKDARADAWVWQDHDQEDAAFLYARLDRAGQDPRVKENARSAVLRRADAQPVQTTGFNWTQANPRARVMGGAMSTPKVAMARAHWLSGDERRLGALVLSCQSGLGANPVNLCYTTGLGQDWPRNPLIRDSRIAGLPASPGITVYGPADPRRQTDDLGQNLVAPATYPVVETWPTAEAYFDAYRYPLVCGSTVMQSIAPNAYVMGYLAARK